MGAFGRNGVLMARVRCPLCSCTGHYPAFTAPLRSGQRDGTDPWFGLPLYLSEAVGQECLWVYNLTHLTVLEAYLDASLRERAIGLSEMTMMARLPRWMKSAAARPKLRRAFSHLRAKAEQAGLS
ncbi:MAG TPA: hypothetical protein VK980_06830 [Sphingomonas sp.]|nr:hypothetical protein [Sphingomonas sp.]